MNPENESLGNMGGKGSGRRDDGTGSRNKPKAAIAVCGSGAPERPPGLPAAAVAAWDWLVSQTSGLTFAQDALALEECARLWADQQKLHAALTAIGPLDDEYDRLTKTRLANTRQLLVLFARLGLTPRDRQSLLRPEASEPELDEFEKMLQQRGD